jgi:hypothetical protein
MRQRSGDERYMQTQAFFDDSAVRERLKIPRKLRCPFTELFRYERTWMAIRQRFLV